MISHGISFHGREDVDPSGKAQGGKGRGHAPTEDLPTVRLGEAGVLPRERDSRSRRLRCRGCGRPFAYSIGTPMFHARMTAFMVRQVGRENNRKASHLEAGREQENRLEMAHQGTG